MLPFSGQAVFGEMMVVDGAGSTQFSLATLQAFNRCVLQLANLAREAGGSHFIADGLRAFRQLVPFASSWWGEMSGVAGSVAPQNWMHGRIDLPPAFAVEWREVAGHDSFAMDTLSKPGKVVRDSEFTDPVEAVNDFARRYDLYHLMSISFELPDSNLTFFVCLYRGEHEVAFSAQEEALFAAFCEHLLQLWRFQVQDMIRSDTANGANDFAVARLDGSLLYIGARLLAVMEREVPGWHGSQLPPAVIAQFAQVPCVMRLGRSALTLSANAEHVILSLEPAAPGVVLAPRERTAAMLFAAGHSYKEIARILSLSPATVRTYLRNCYAQLGVKSKVELGSALRSPATLAEKTA